MNTVTRGRPSNAAKRLTAQMDALTGKWYAYMDWMGGAPRSDRRRRVRPPNAATATLKEAAGSAGCSPTRAKLKGMPSKSGVGRRAKAITAFYADGKVWRSFASMSLAAEAVGRSKGALSLAITGRTRTAGGFTWKYA